MKDPPKIAVIGAGPIGLEAARQAIDLGYRVLLFEQGEIASAVRKWKHVRLFSPRSMNKTRAGQSLISGGAFPQEKCETGDEFIESYLIPLSNWISERAKVMTKTKVKSISRGDLLKGDAIGSRHTQGQPFRLLVENHESERVERVDYVLDCSGVTGQPNSLGTGGIPCPGESRFQDKIIYGLPTNEQISELEHCSSILIVGAGYSAATLIRKLVQQDNRHHSPKVFWLTRNSSPSGPMTIIENDSLSQRKLLAEDVNQLALSEREGFEWISGSVVESLKTAATTTGVEVTMRHFAEFSLRSIEVERVVACTGYHPDLSLTSELQIHECYATSGPMKLAASLIGQSGLDCTKISAGAAETLINPETGYYFLGARSYGRNSQFLIQTGYQQVELVMELIEKAIHDQTAKVITQ